MCAGTWEDRIGCKNHGPSATFFYKGRSIINGAVLVHSL